MTAAAILWECFLRVTLLGVFLPRVPLLKVNLAVYTADIPTVGKPKALNLLI